MENRKLYMAGALFNSPFGSEGKFRILMSQFDWVQKAAPLKTVRLSNEQQNEHTRSVKFRMENEP
jgi:hypothetical protein